MSRCVYCNRDCGCSTKLKDDEIFHSDLVSYAVARFRLDKEQVEKTLWNLRPTPMEGGKMSILLDNYLDALPKDCRKDFKLITDELLISYLPPTGRIAMTLMLERAIEELTIYMG